VCIQFTELPTCSNNNILFRWCQNSVRLQTDYWSIFISMVNWIIHRSYVLTFRWLSNSINWSICWGVILSTIFLLSLISSITMWADFRPISPYRKTMMKVCSLHSLILHGLNCIIRMCTVDSANRRTRMAKFLTQQNLSQVLHWLPVTIKNLKTTLLCRSMKWRNNGSPSSLTLHSVEESMTILWHTLNTTRSW